MDINQYHDAINQVIKHIEEVSTANDMFIDIEENGNVCTLYIEGQNEQIVISRQEAKFELWLAARVIGAFHFTYQDGKWISTTEKKDFYTYLNQAFKQLGIAPLF